MNDKWLKVSFDYYGGSLYVPPALQSKFMEMMRSCMILKERSDPMITQEHVKVWVEERPPSLEYADEPLETHILTQEQYAERDKEAEKLRDDLEEEDTD